MILTPEEEADARRLQELLDQYKDTRFALEILRQEKEGKAPDLSAASGQKTN